MGLVLIYDLHSLMSFGTWLCAESSPARGQECTEDQWYENLLFAGGRVYQQPSDHLASA